MPKLHDLNFCRISFQQKQQAVVVSTPTKAEKITESFDKSVYLKEQASIAKKWEDFYKDFTPEKSRPSLLELYTNVSYFLELSFLLIFVAFQWGLDIRKFRPVKKKTP